MVHLQAMKKKIAILSSIFIVSVLFSILFQSFHSYTHFSEQRLEKKCHHKYKSEKEITHQHHNLENCFVCAISFGNYITPEFYSFQFFSDNNPIPYFLKLPENITFFSGSNFSLRGPPQFIA